MKRMMVGCGILFVVGIMLGTTVVFYPMWHHRMLDSRFLALLVNRPSLVFYELERRHMAEAEDAFQIEEEKRIANARADFRRVLIEKGFRDRYPDL